MTSDLWSVVAKGWWQHGLRLMRYLVTRYKRVMVTDEDGLGSCDRSSASACSPMPCSEHGDFPMRITKQTLYEVSPISSRARPMTRD